MYGRMAAEHSEYVAKNAQNSVGEPGPIISTPIPPARHNASMTCVNLRGVVCEEMATHPIGPSVAMAAVAAK